jgi:hypothetical protein
MRKLGLGIVMAKRGPKPAPKLWRSRPDNTLISRTGRFFRKLGFSVLHPMQFKPNYDLWVERRENDNTRRIAVACGRPEVLDDEELLEFVRTSGAELWYVDDEVTDDARRMARRHVFTRAATLEELGSIEQIGDPNLALTAIGQAVNRNHDSIVISVGALAIMLDDRIEALRLARPNEERAQKAREDELAELNGLRSRLSELRVSVVRFRAKRVSEATLNRAASSFWSTVKSWYKKNHQRVLTQVSDVSIFLVCTTIASMLGVQPTVAASISLALVRGTSAPALKKIAKRLMRLDE